MIKEAISQLKTAFLMLLTLTILTGIAYPLLITGLAQTFFPWQANGSIIKRNNQEIGSLLIGQAFTGPKYFWGRPSATSPFPYNPEASSGSNLGPSNPALLTAVRERAQYLQKFASSKKEIPVDLVTTSGSGLDPDISPWAALYQVPRIAKTRHISEMAIEQLINQLVQKRRYLLLGEPHVNVLQLNMALDALKV